MGWKRILLSLVWGLALAAWAGLFLVYSTDPSTKVWTIAVTGAAILTEIAFWTTAGILGISIWESRKQVFQFLTRPFRSN